MKHWWFKKPKKQKPKSPFGGSIKSQQEIQNLNKKINQIEEKELAEFDQDFENLWQEATTNASSEHKTSHKLSQ